MDFSRFKVISFDCYGTLIDWETGIWDALQRLFLANDAAPVSRAAALAAYAEEESRQQEADPNRRYDRILADTHRVLAKRWGLQTSQGLDEAFAESIGCWPAFADTAESLRALKRHCRLVILSNVHNYGFELTAPKLGVDFDAVHTAENIGSYKPSEENFRYLLRHVEHDFDCAPHELLHVAQSPFHDIAPAKRLGITTVWIDRQGLAEGGGWGAIPRLSELPQPDAHYPDLASLAREFAVT